MARAAAAWQTHLLRDQVLRPVVERHGRRTHVAVNVPARAQRGAHGADDGGEHRFQVTLQHAVQLVCLPRREPQRAVAILVRQVVHCEVQLVGHLSRRLARAHHELVVLALAERALLAVVLHVGAVKLHELLRRFVDAGRLAHKLLHQRVPQIVALLLDDFHLRARRGVRRGRLGRRRHCSGERGGGWARHPPRDARPNTGAARQRTQPCILCAWKQRSARVRLRSGRANAAAACSEQQGVPAHRKRPQRRASRPARARGSRAAAGGCPVARTTESGRELRAVPAMDNATCRRSRGLVFFPSKGSQSEEARAMRTARALCCLARPPVSRARWRS